MKLDKEASKKAGIKVMRPTESKVEKVEKYSSESLKSGSVFSARERCYNYDFNLFYINLPESS